MNESGTRARIPWSVLFLVSLVTFAMVHIFLGASHVDDSPQQDSLTTTEWKAPCMHNGATMDTHHDPQLHYYGPNSDKSYPDETNSRNTSVRCSHPLEVAFTGREGEVQHVRSWGRCHFQWLSYSRGAFTIHGMMKEECRPLRERDILLSRANANSRSPVLLPLEFTPHKCSENECTHILRGKYYLLHRWSLSNICRAHESLLSLWRAMLMEKDLEMEESDGDVTRLMVLDTEDDTLFSAYWTFLTPHIDRLSDLISPITPSRVCFEHAVVVGDDFLPSLHRASPSTLDVYRKFWFNFADNVTYTPTKDNDQLNSNMRLKSWNDTVEPRIVILHRNTAPTLVNEEALVKELRKRTKVQDIRSVDLTQLSLRHQIKLLQQTTILIGAHSGDLAHVMWMQPGSTVIQLLPYKTQYGMKEYETLDRGHPPYVLNVETLSRKLGLFFFNFVSSERRHTTHCEKKAREEKWDRTLEYECYLRAKVAVDVERVVKLVVRQLRTGVHLGLAQWVPESVTDVRRIIIPRTSTRSGGSESMALLVNQINNQAMTTGRLGDFSAHLATIKATSKSALFVPQFDPLYFSMENHYPNYHDAFVFPAPFFPHNLRPRDVFIMTELLPPLMQYFLDEAEKKGTDVWFFVFGHTITSGAYARDFPNKYVHYILRESVKRLRHPSHIVATSHWLHDLYHCQQPTLFIPLSEPVYAQAYPYLSPSMRSDLALDENGFSSLPATGQKRVPKENLVVIDSDNRLSVDLLLPHVSKEIEVVKLGDYTFEETIHLLKRAKVIVDLFLPGRERIGLEAALFDCCVLVGTKWNGGDPVDYPFDHSLKFEVDHEEFLPYEWIGLSYPKLGGAITGMVKRYDTLLPEFERLKHHAWNIRSNYTSVFPDLVEQIVSGSPSTEGDREMKQYIDLLNQEEDAAWAGTQPFPEGWRSLRFIEGRGEEPWRK